MTHGPTLAVLPFRTTTPDDADTLLAQGLLEDLCGELTRFPALQVISWMSAQEVADLPDPEVGRQLAATHLLRGRLRRDGHSLRVTASLVEAASGTQVWTEQFQTPLEALFELQDEIVARIAATLVARLEERALTGAQRKPPEALAAYEATLRGMMLLRQGTPEADTAARALFTHALELDPHYARAHGGLSLSWFNEWSCQFWDCYETNAREAYAHAHRALDLDDRDPLLHLVIGRIQLYRRNFDLAAWYFDRALALCPNDADTLIQLSLCETFLGRPEVGVAHAQKAMRLNPYHPNSYHAYAALAYFSAQDLEAAIASAQQVAHLPIVDTPAYIAVALAYLGRLDEARPWLAAYQQAFSERILRGRTPAQGEAFRWLLAVNPYRRESDQAYLRNGFRLLGMDTGSEDTAAGMTHAIDGTAADAHTAPDAEVFARRGDAWLLRFRGRESIIADMKGLHDIRRLLERPGDALHCLDLAERGDDTYGGDKILDTTARRSVQSRIRDLQEALAEAEDMNDLGRSEVLRNELDDLVETLARALGLGQRTRRLGSLSERARSTVTWRIRHALRKLHEVHEPLGRHLENSLRTGTFCSYRPEQPVRWRFDPGIAHTRA
jgi:TolB-like protein